MTLKSHQKSFMVDLRCPTPRPRPGLRLRPRELGSVIMCGKVFTAPSVEMCRLNEGFSLRFGLPCCESLKSLYFIMNIYHTSILHQSLITTLKFSKIDY